MLFKIPASVSSLPSLPEREAPECAGRHPTFTQFPVSQWNACAHCRNSDWHNQQEKLHMSVHPCCEPYTSWGVNYTQVILWILGKFYHNRCFHAHGSNFGCSWPLRSLTTQTFWSSRRTEKLHCGRQRNGRGETIFRIISGAYIYVCITCCFMR